MSAPKCKCSHPRADHGRDRKDRPTCYGSAVCGCRGYRSPDVDAAMQRHPAGKAKEAARVRAYKKADRQPCGIEGCTQPLYCKGMCVMHYSRARKRGDVGSAGRERHPLGSGYVNEYGYRVIKAPGHPLATAQNKALEHRVVLYDALGPGQHPCHWCGKELPWVGGSAVCINVDHLDENRLNNDPSNLVPSCLDCNTKRSAA